MNHEHDNEVDQLIRAAMKPQDSIDERHLSEVRSRITSLIRAHVAQAPTARRRSLSVGAIAIAVGILIPTGIAVAAAVHHTFTKSDPISHKIDQLNDEHLPVANDADYKAITEFAALYNRNPVGDPIQLADQSKSRVIADDRSIGRVVGVPSTDGTRWCYRAQRPAANDDQPRPQGWYPTTKAACSEMADVTGVNYSLQYETDADEGNPRNFAVFGLASDDVTKIEIELPDGTVEPATLKDNAFVWRSATQWPTTIRWAVAGRSETARIEPAR
jgi:hypothetical protein